MKGKLLLLHELNSFIKDGRSLGILVLLVIVIASSCIYGAYKTRELMEKSESDNQSLVEYLSNAKNIYDIRELTYISIGPQTLSFYCPQAAAEQTKMVLLPSMKYRFNFTFMESESSEWFKARAFDKFDYSHSVKYILALFSIILGAISVAKEKEAGTLKYLSAYGVPLKTVVIAKTISGIILIFLAFLLAMTMSLLYIEIAIFQGVAERIVDICMITSGGALLISLFYLVGVTVSMFVYSSLQAVIIAVAVWAIQLFLLPGAVQMLAGEPEKMDERTDRQVMTNISREEGTKFLVKLAQDCNALKLRNDELKGYFNNPKYRGIFERNVEEQNDNMESRYQAHMAEKINSSKGSFEKIVFLSVIDPSSSYEGILKKRTGLGPQHFEETYKSLVRYAKEYKKYLDSIEDKVDFGRQMIRNEDGADGFLKWSFQDRNKVNLDFSDRPQLDLSPDPAEILTPAVIRFLTSITIWLFICTILIIVRIRKYDVR